MSLNLKFKLLKICTCALASCIFLLTICIKLENRQTQSPVILANVESFPETTTQEFIEVPQDPITVDKASLIEDNLPSTVDIYASDLASTIVVEHNKTGLPVYIICTLTDSESSFRKDKHSPAGPSSGIGLTMVSVYALADWNSNHIDNQYSTEDMYDIEKNLEVGCWYFSYMYNKPECNSYTDAYIAYNVGYSNYIKYKDSYYQGYDPHYNRAYKALDNWNNKYSIWSDYLEEA